MRSPARSGWLGRLLRAPAWLYHWHLGWLLGHRFLLVEHVGRTTGKPYETVLEVVHYDRVRREPIVVSGFGPTADWYRNVLARGDATIRIGHERAAARAAEVPLALAVEVLRDYERRNALVAPIVRAVLSRLLGWRYTSTDADRLRAVQQLPMVCFVPRSTEGDPIARDDEPPAVTT